MSGLVFIDTETTGLNPAIHQVWELAYATEEGDVHSGVVYHSLANADPTALRLNGYHERSYPQKFSAMQELEEGARTALRGSTLVAANPHFDASFLEARWGGAVWHYRLLDVEAYAMAVLKFDRPKGMKDIALALADRGFVITQPDHSAGSDVAALRESFYALQKINAGETLNV